MGKILFIPFSIGAGLAAGFAAKKTFDAVWGMVDEEEAPEPEHRNVPWTKLVAALAIEGAIFRAMRGVAERGTRVGFERLTGTWPGEEGPG